ncbi:MAG: metallophosphoesterase [Sandaracinaceae bacterium]|nr:metallophosphoesterase [Sandaracinaceae bacterium]
MPFWARITFFVVAMLALTFATSLYVHRRVSRVYGLGRRAERALAVLFVVGPVLLVTSRLAERPLGDGAAEVMGALGFAIVLAATISSVLLAPVDLIRWLGTKLRRAPATTIAQPAEPPSEVTLGRRELAYQLGVTVAVGAGFGASAYGTLFGRHDYAIEHVPIPIDGLSRRLDGYRIAQLSDIHFGIYVGEAERRAAVELVRRARPDLIVLTGDLVDHDPRHASELGRLVRQLGELGTRDGVVVIPGNHDYYAGIDEVLGTVRDAGARVLRNAGRVIGDEGGAFALLGVDDVWAPRNGYGPGPDLARAKAMAPPDLPRILLCHNPEAFPRFAGDVALQLSGHTHGGQVALGINPAEIVLPYVRGLYEENGSRLYVNRGFGTAGPPARVGSPPEVTLVHLTS